jgi:hypothetical protein
MRASAEKFDQKEPKQKNEREISFVENKERQTAPSKQRFELPKKIKQIKGAKTYFVFFNTK